MIKNLEPIEDKISNRKRTFLDMGIFEDDGSKKLIYRKYEADENWKKVLQSVFESYKVDQVWIDIFAGNGNSKIFVESVTVDNSMMNYHNQLPSAPLSGVGNLSNVPEPFINYMLNDKELKIREKEELIRELKDQQKLDQDTIKKLNERNTELETDVKFQAREFALQKKEDELLEKENSKSGLGGIVEQVSQNEQFMEIAKMGIGALIAKWTSGSSVPGQVPPLGNIYDPTISAERNEYIKNIVNWLKNQGDENFARFMGIVQVIDKNPNMMFQLINFINNAGNNGDSSNQS